MQRKASVSPARSRQDSISKISCQARTSSIVSPQESLASLSRTSSQSSLGRDRGSFCQSSISRDRGSFCHVSVRVKPDPDSAHVWKPKELTIELSPEHYDRRTREVFNFDSVFEGSDNHELYNVTVKDLVKGAMEGIDSTVFAYGQTASGKTYSMMGYEEQPGIIPQAVEDVFDYIRDLSEDREFLLRVSYLEIYNEKIRDLLNPIQGDLKLSIARRRLVCVSQLREEVVTNPKQLMGIIARGEANRSTFSTENNQNSSRSHTIFQLTIESRTIQKTEDQDIIVLQSQLNLIDLAGSEKAVNDSDRQKEGSFINKSLLTLGNVIAKITQESRYLIH